LCSPILEIGFSCPKPQHKKFARDGVKDASAKVQDNVDPNAELHLQLESVFPRLWRYCLVVAGNRDRADDLAQAVCLRAIERSHQFEAGTHLDRWLFKIAQRVWIDEMRKQAVRLGGGIMAVEDADLVDTKLDPEANVMGQQVMKEVMALPEAQRTVVFLVYVEGKSYKQAAEIVDTPIGTIMSRLAAARRKIAEKFQDESGTK
jgi:RNA polymerase sigma-70 factor (ECF subfamily)